MDIVLELTEDTSGLEKIGEEITDANTKVSQLRDLLPDRWSR